MASCVSSVGAVGGRVGTFAAGLRAGGWTVEVIDLTPQRLSRIRALLDRLPPPVSRIAEEAGFEGDVSPSISMRAKNAVAQVSASAAVVSVPPFSLLPAVARGLPASVPLVIDYRDRPARPRSQLARPLRAVARLHPLARARLERGRNYWPRSRVQLMSPAIGGPLF
jgi:hypothetical protein